MKHVKICGITNLTDATNAARNGASMLGFIFYPASSSAITPEAASYIINAIPHPRPLMIGVIVDKSADEIATLLGEVPLDGVQVHGTTTPEDLESFEDLLVIKALRIPPKALPSTAASQEVIITQWLSSLPKTLFLIDTLIDGLEGGTGKITDWSVARDLSSRYPVILSGGLTPDTIGDAIRQCVPIGVDAKSGIERCPGKKDPLKVSIFIHEAHLAFARSTPL